MNLGILPIVKLPSPSAPNLTLYPLLSIGTDLTFSIKTTGPDLRHSTFLKLLGRQLVGPGPMYASVGEMEYYSFRQDPKIRLTKPHLASSEPSCNTPRMHVSE